MTLAALAAVTLSGVAVAADATRLTDEEMDNVTAAGPGLAISAMARQGVGGPAISNYAKTNAPGQSVSAAARNRGLGLSNNLGAQGQGRGLGRSFAPGLN